MGKRKLRTSETEGRTESTLRRCSNEEFREKADKGDGTSDQTGKNVKRTPTSRCKESTLRRCSTAQHNEKADKEDGTANQPAKKVNDVHTLVNEKADEEGATTNHPDKEVKGICSVAGDGSKPSMVKKLPAPRLVKRALSPRAVALYERGFSLRTILRLLGHEDAFTNWRDGASIFVTLRYGSAGVASIYRTHQRKLTHEEYMADLLKRGYKPVA